MTAALRTEGKTPEDRLSLIMWVMVGSRGLRFSISRGVGMGSREQDVGFELKGHTSRSKNLHNVRT